MAVRERTREIGTVRAIGMQKNQVSLSFIMESVFLSLFASIAGIVAGFIVMHLISLVTFNPENMFSIFLDEGHVHFLYNLKTISGDLMLIVIITILTAYFPARRAANLSVAHALGHYE
jgi:putative ABC transport system permease protein